MKFLALVVRPEQHIQPHKSWMKILTARREMLQQLKIPHGVTFMSLVQIFFAIFSGSQNGFKKKNEKSKMHLNILSGYIALFFVG